MTRSLKIAALSAFTLIAIGAVAEAAQPHGKHHPLSQGSNPGQHSFRPFKHQSGGNTGGMKQSGSGMAGMKQTGSHKPFVSHCDHGPCKGTTKPPVIVHCDPGPCKGTTKPPVVVHCDHGPCKGKPNKESHHRPPHWPPFGHHQHVEYRERYVYGYRPGGYERPSYAPQPSYVQPSYVQPSYAPRPSYAAYAPAPAPAPVPAGSCLSKEYLNNGPVLFKDICTKEWAMGEASPTHGINVGCLRKEYIGGGVVKFSDICTKEWATNAPADQQAKAPASQEEEDDDED